MTYEEFANARLAALSRFALMLTGDPHSAQDLVQETMVRVQMKWGKVVRADAPERYVRRMMTNLYVDSRRSSWLRRVHLRAEYGDSPTTDADAAQRLAERDLMWSVLATPPRQQRAALVLRVRGRAPRLGAALLSLVLPH